MIRGSISCKCGQSFSFESMLDTIACPDCQTIYKTAEHGEEIEGDIDSNMEKLPDKEEVDVV